MHIYLLFKITINTRNLISKISFQDLRLSHKFLKHLVEIDFVVIIISLKQFCLKNCFAHLLLKRPLKQRGTAWCTGNREPSGFLVSGAACICIPDGPSYVLPGSVSPHQWTDVFPIPSTFSTRIRVAWRSRSCASSDSLERFADVSSGTRPWTRSLVAWCDCCQPSSCRLKWWSFVNDFININTKLRTLVKSYLT